MKIGKLRTNKGFSLMARVAILEDDVRVAKFIADGLKVEAYQVEIFTVINQLIDTLQEQAFDILIMDRLIGKLDAVSWIKTIRSLRPNIKILILSALSGSINRIKGLEVGADDYLEKPFQYHELSLRVKKLVKKETSSPESIINYEDITLELDGQKMQRAGKVIHLSPYEFKLMTIFVKNPQKIHSRTELLDRVWGYNIDTGSNVVDVAIAKLRKKINFATCEPLIISRRGSGYILSNTQAW